jgi:hypothetical protein
MMLASNVLRQPRKEDDYLIDDVIKKSIKKTQALELS